ncbi:MAG: preprotein translocase subunit SecY [Candidatus Kapaibacteriales bacterium]
MANFAETFQNIFKIPELKSRILFTLMILLVVRIGAHISVPGVDLDLIMNADPAASSDEGLFGFFDIFVGGALSNAAIFALGIMPYITATIIFQLAGIVMPQIQKMQREGEEGRRKLNQYSRLLTVAIGLLQSIAIAIKIGSTEIQNQNIVPNPDFMFYVTAVVLMTAGVIFMMWLGEQITEKGIGNGISLIIFIGIIAALPSAAIAEYKSRFVSDAPFLQSLFIELIIIGILIVIIALVILITQGARRIPVQYAKRQVGRKVYGGQTNYIPLRVNTAGVMPIIFAQALIFIPQTLAGFFPDSEAMRNFAGYFAYDSAVYAIVFFFMVVFFTYFYTAIIFNPKDIADNMKKQGGFIPGVRPGAPTKEYIDRILTRITLPGSIFLGLVAILPSILPMFIPINPYFAPFFGGTSLLIIIGVALDTLQQIESHLMMRHYDGFMKTGKIRGRVGANI